MSSRFNRYLRGFLGLLDSKVGGLTPTDYEDAIRVTLASEPFLHAQMREVGLGNTAAFGNLTLGFQALAGVVGDTGECPEGEIWLVSRANARIVDPGVVGGDRVVFAVAMRVRNPGAGGFQDIILGRTSPYEVATAIAYSPTAYAEGPFVMTPGDRLGPYVTQAELSAAATVEVRVSYTFQRCPI